MTSPNTESQTKALLDKLAINETLDRYWYGAALHDIDYLLTAFTEDARFGSANGHGEIRTRLSGMSRVTFMNCIRGSQHVVVDGERADADTQSIAFLVTDAGADQKLSVVSTRYLDQLVRTENGWLIQRRTGQDITKVHDTDFRFLIGEQSPAST
jgi:hypothetical protein